MSDSCTDDDDDDPRKIWNGKKVLVRRNGSHPNKSQEIFEYLDLGSRNLSEEQGSLIENQLSTSRIQKLTITYLDHE